MTITQPLSPSARNEIVTMVRSKVSDTQRVNEWNKKAWSYGDLCTTLRSYSDEVLIALNNHLLLEPSGFRQREDRDQFLFHLAQKDEKLSGTIVHELITFSKCLENDIFSTKLNLLEGLHSYNQFSSLENLANANEGTKTKIIALLSVASDLQRKDFIMKTFALLKPTVGPKGDHTKLETGIPITSDGILKITDEIIVALLLERPESADEITSMILEQEIHDGVLIREIVTSDTQSIRSGLL